MNEQMSVGILGVAGEEGGEAPEWTSVAFDLGSGFIDCTPSVS